MKVVTDHGWPKASDGSDENAFDAFKNERNYIAQSGRMKTTVAAMDWAAREIERLRAEIDLWHHSSPKPSKPYAWIVRMPGGETDLFRKEEDAKVEAEKWWRGEVVPLFA